MKTKVILLQEKIVKYRIPIYNLISKQVNLTVAFRVDVNIDEDISFKKLKLEFLSIGGFYFAKDLHKICSNYEVVIFMADLHYISYCILPFRSRKFKVIPWTMGIRASYTKRFDINRSIEFVDKIYVKVLNKSDAIIFYSKQPLKFWKKLIRNDKVFIANNTVQVQEKTVNNKKSKILFLGTLYKEKKIYELIDSFIKAKNNLLRDDFYTLSIVGNGIEYENIDKLINENKFKDSIFLHGSIFEENLLADLYSESILCISPDQAGLTILKSMGYGVPFVTRINAITGGERFNVINNYNGILYKDKKELVDIIQDSFLDPKKYIDMGNNAKKYYSENATPEIMANGVINAIRFSLKIKGE